MEFDHTRIVLGERHGWERPVPFSMANKDQRNHIYLIGKTGVGKSTLLLNVIAQHIEAGHGVGLIDPHGDLAEALLDYIPRYRSDHLVYFNPADTDFPIGFNLLQTPDAESRHLLVSGVVDAFRSLWTDSWGPRMEYILSNALTALTECPNTTLLGVNRLLIDPDFRAWVVRQVRDPFVRQFWSTEYEGYDARFQREAIAPIQNKVGRFLMSPLMRNILGQVRSRIDFPFMMDHGRIFIANLSKGRLGYDKSNLLGSLLVTQFQLAAMLRARLPEEARRDFYLFIDEFQNFSTEAFATILAEARKYRLCLTLSHQYMDQLPLSVRSAVLGNVGTILAFRVGHSDAEILSHEFGGSHIPEDFVHLDRFELLAKVTTEGTQPEPFRARTLAPPAPALGRREALIAHSRQRFGTPRQAVEGKLDRWMRAHGSL